MSETFAEFFVVGLVMLAIITVVIYGPMVIVAGLMWLAGL